MMTVHDRYAQILRSRYPILSEQDSVPDVHALIFPEVIEIPAAAIRHIQALVRALFSLRELASYRQRIATADREILGYEPGNKSVLMGYDFHLDANGHPWLIEVNTNAAFSLGSDVLSECQSIDNPFVPSFLEALKASFLEEYGLARPGAALETIALIDETYRSQNYYFEFLMFRQVFERWGWRCMIGAPEDFRCTERGLEHQSGVRIDLVYNRLVDFLLAKPAHRHLRRAYLEGRTCFSPNPNEYLLLADKQRLVEWSTPGWLESTGLRGPDVEAIRHSLPRSLDLEAGADVEYVWRERKRLFFKPKQSFGAKGAYRGANITRKRFAEIVQRPYIAQEFVPPATLAVMDAAGARREYKYDLRFYVYKDAVQLMVGRVYQGQVTNLRTPGGGFAALRIAG
jgi:hypothetical protein